MLVKCACRIAVVGASLTLLAGCAAPRGGEAEADGAYFARDLPGMPANPLMSPVDNPHREAGGLHNPPPTLIRRALLAEHERWAGTPYRLGGTSYRGVDCSALVQSVFSDSFRFDLPRTTKAQLRSGHEVEREALRPGDLVFFRPPGTYRHVGIYVGEGRFLHASTSRGVMISKLDNRYWQRYYWQARRALAPVQLAQRLDAVGEG